MPYTNYFDQLGFIFESVNNPIWRNNHFMEILLIELRDDSAHARMLMKHLHPSNNPEGKMFSPLRAVP